MSHLTYSHMHVTLLTQIHTSLLFACNVFYCIHRSSNDDVDLLKRELVAIQLRMDEITLEKEREIGKLRSALIEKFVE